VVVALVGLGYRLELQNNRDLVSPQNMVIESLASETVHQLVARVGLACEYRWFDHLSMQLHLRADQPLSGPDTGLEIAAGVFIGLYFYPH
jgi:hypothetical protein